MPAGAGREKAACAREEDAGHAALAVLTAHAALEAMVNRLGSEAIGSFNYRARFLPEWHDLCARTLGRQLQAAPDLERFRPSVTRWSAISATPSGWIAGPRPLLPRHHGRSEPRKLAEFHQAAGREPPDWV